MALITGASRGIGSATARRLAAAGASVALTARDEDALLDVADAIRHAGGRALTVAADVSDPETLEPLIEETLERFQRIDILINNAGVLWPLDETADADLDEWAYNVHVNLVGPFYLIRTVLPLMQAQNYGRILNISSGAAARPIPGWGAYCAAKAGLDMLTRVVAEELRGADICINALYPGLVNTEMQADIRSVDTSESSLDFSYWQDAFEQNKLLAPDDVARMIYWIVGPWGRAASGQIFKAGDETWHAQVAQDIAL
ncbi:MAG: SDR family oxidoreductase [Caldilineaceae bacterium]|nr:SDR family oxidoreductase [Caldilineaceae bacterium]MCB9137022.1 SDR family oxidoreductase [Caldilineaceae bacterium]